MSSFFCVQKTSMLSEITLIRQQSAGTVCCRLKTRITMKLKLLKAPFRVSLLRDVQWTDVSIYTQPADWHRMVQSCADSKIQRFFFQLTILAGGQQQIRWALTDSHSCIHRWSVLHTQTYTKKLIEALCCCSVIIGHFYSKSDLFFKLKFLGILLLSHTFLRLSTPHSSTLLSASSPLCSYLSDLGLFAGYLCPCIPKGEMFA